MAHSSSYRNSTGGDFEIDWQDFFAESQSPSLFATGRDALVAILSDKPKNQGSWLVPDFICPVVPDTLRYCGMVVRPYGWLTPWRCDIDGLKQLVPGASGIVVPFYMGLPPGADIWEIVSDTSLTVIEDRCQVVGPQPSRETVRGDYAIGSFRKWLPTTDGAYCVARVGSSPRPSRPPNYDMILARLIAALVKQRRIGNPLESTPASAEDFQVEFFRLGEHLAGVDAGGRAASSIAAALIGNADFKSISERRLTNQKWLISQLEGMADLGFPSDDFIEIARAGVPMLGLPVMCRDRDRIQNKLSARGIFCAIHWRDGNWTRQNGMPATLAAQVLSLPIDQRYDPVRLKRVVETLSR